MVSKSYRRKKFKVSIKEFKVSSLTDGNDGSAGIMWDPVKNAHGNENGRGLKRGWLIEPVNGDDGRSSLTPGEIVDLLDYSFIY